MNEVYELYMDGKVASFHWSSMRDALYRAESRRLIDRMISDVPMWPWRIHEP